jgi:hypothetical protein
VHIYVNKGNYNVKLTTVSDLGCPYSSLKMNFIQSTLSITNKPYNSILAFYPNPVINELKIENPSNISHSFTLTDMYGKEVLRNSIPPGRHVMTIQELKPGLYFITVDGIMSGKLVVE